MKPHAHIRMLTHSNMQIHILNHDKIDMESTWDLERGRKLKKRREKHQRNVLKTRHCKLFCPAQSAMRCACVHQLSQDGSSILLQPLCICSLHLEDTESFISRQKPNWGMQRVLERWRDGRMSHVLLRITEGRVQLSWLVTPLSVSGLCTEY